VAQVLGELAEDVAIDLRSGLAESMPTLMESSARAAPASTEAANNRLRKIFTDSPWPRRGALSGLNGIAS